MLKVDYPLGLHHVSSNKILSNRLYGHARCAYGLLSTRF